MINFDKMLIVQRNKRVCVVAVYASAVDVVAVPARCLVDTGHNELPEDDI